MIDFFNIFGGLIKEDPVFWFCALAGSGLFALQLTFSAIGTHHDADHGEFDTVKFKWLSKQALTGFLMMFGFIGLTCRKEFELSGAASAMVALGGGAVAMLITALIFGGAKKLRSTGTVFRIDDAVGKEAMIYQRIPKDGVGKVSVSLHNFTHEIDAISPCAEDLPSFTPVQIIKKADDKTVLVVPIK